MKGMWEPQVKARKSQSGAGLNLNEAICLRSAQIYLQCLLSGISRLNRKRGFMVCTLAFVSNELKSTKEDSK